MRGRWMRGIVAVGLALGVSLSAQAGGFGFTTKVGTLGLGGDLTFGFSEVLGLRLNVNGANIEDSSAIDNNNYTADLEWYSYGALLDLHPAGGGFRISAGVLRNRDRFSFNAKMGDMLDFDGNQYAVDDFSGKASFREMAPYVGIGYGGTFAGAKGWQFACDFGVLFQGDPDIELNATASDPSLQDALNADLARDAEDLEDDLQIFGFYPVITVGVSYGF